MEATGKEMPRSSQPWSCFHSAATGKPAWDGVKKLFSGSSATQVWCGVHGEKGLCHLLCSHWISTAVLVGLDRFTWWEKAASSCPHHLVSCKKGSSQANIFSVSASPMFIQLINLIISFRKLPQNKTKRWEVHPGSRCLLDPTQQLKGWWIPGAGTTNKKFVLVIE